MEHFTPLASLIGGMLIGLSASMLLLFNGKIAGISGIIAGTLSPAKNDTLWRIVFVAGLLVGGFLLRLLSPQTFVIGITRSWSALVVAGLLVGFGTRLGGGCTSGHGICGVARLSDRSIAATVIFMLVAIVTVALTRHVLGG